jgi:hypothetical protein
MASNGALDPNFFTYFFKGVGTFSGLPSTWGIFRTWAINPVQLEYNSGIIDLGTIKSVRPLVDLQADGVARVEILYSETSSDLSTDTTTIGSLSELYSSLGYYESGYSDASYGPITCRYVQFKVYVADIDGAGDHNVSQIRFLNYTFDDTPMQEFQPRVDTQQLDGLAISDGSVVSGTLNNVTKRIIVPQKTFGLITSTNVVQNQIGASDTTYHIVPEIQYDKDSTGRLYYIGHDIDRWDNSHSDSVIDITIVGLKEVRELVSGGLG